LNSRNAKSVLATNNETVCPLQELLLLIHPELKIRLDLNI